MKPLTIEELKALEVGDWVWIVDVSDCGNCNRGSYRQIDYMNVDAIMLDGQCYGSRRYSEYGTKWLAYKNKEQAEAKGEIVELPCLRRTNVYCQELQLVFMNELNQIQVFNYDEEELDIAKRRLAELKGENKND